MPEGATFIGQTFYGSIGYTVGATLGASIAARDRPVVLFVGDGSFQVTGQDLSTMVRYKVKPIVFVNNDGYTIERVICDRPYNDLQPWHSQAGRGLRRRDRAGRPHRRRPGEGSGNRRQRKELVFIEIHLGRLDCSDSLKRAGETMARTNRLLEG